MPATAWIKNFFVAAFRTGPDPVEEKQKRRVSRRLARREEERTKVATALQEEKNFQVWTVDGLYWICPYTGNFISSPFFTYDAAEEWLLAKRPWRRGAQPRSLEDLQVARWLVHLQRYIRTEWNLRQFDSEGRWLNPFNGTWMARKKATHPIESSPSLQEIAQFLAKDPGDEPLEPLPRAHLEGVIAGQVKEGLPRELRKRRPTPPPPPKTRPAIVLPTPTGYTVTGTCDRSAGFFLEAHDPGNGFQLLVAAGDTRNSGFTDGSATFLDRFHEAAKGTLDPEALAAKLATIIRTLGPDGTGVPIALVLIDRKKQQASVILAGLPEACAGNPEDSKSIQAIGRPVPALGGTAGGKMAAKPKATIVPMKAGDSILLHTGAMAAAKDKDGKLLGFQRLNELFLSHLGQRPDKVLRMIGMDVGRFSGGDWLDGSPVVLISRVEEEDDDDGDA